MQPRISSNTNLAAFSREGKRTMDVLIPLYAECGYRALDLNFCEMMNPCSALKGEGRRAYLERLATLRDELGLEYIHAHAPYPRDSRPSVEMDEDILSAMEAASFLDLTMIIVHPIKGTVRENIEYFSSLLERQEAPLRIAVENMESKDGIWSAKDLVEIASALSPMAGICLDTGHANICGVDIPSFIDEAGELLIATHIADNDGMEDQHLLPGFGSIPWEKVIPAFRESYQGYLNFECMFFSRNMPQSLSKDVVKLSLAIGEWLLSL